jgi:polyphosphate glucokinase
MAKNVFLGVDIGGTGIKAALIDVHSGNLVSEKFRLLTPQPATPDAVLSVFKEVIHHFKYSGPVGCGFPSVIKNNKVMTATNMDQSWINIDISTFFSKALNLPVYLLNDADAAGLAEIHFGAAKGKTGLVVVITIGTGVGSGMFFDQKLISNTELGFLPIKGGIAEIRISNKTKVKSHLSWLAWAKRLNEFLHLIEHLFSPEIIVIGGGISKKFDLYKAYLNIETEVTPAETQNNAGCIGAAWFASNSHYKLINEPALK